MESSGCKTTAAENGWMNGCAVTYDSGVEIVRVVHGGETRRRLMDEAVHTPFGERPASRDVPIYC